MAYAKGTEVASEKTRVEIERLLLKNGATMSGVMQEVGWATILFIIDRWEVQMRVPLPTLKEAAAVRVRELWVLDEAAQKRWVEQGTRERWRQLLAVLKAKFIALENGVETFEQCFLAHLVVGGQALGDKLLPALRHARDAGAPLALPGGN